MRVLLILSLCLSLSASALSNRELLTLDSNANPPMDSARLDDVRAAVGLLVEDKGDRHFHSLTGFFYEPSLFLTTRSPDHKVLPNCEKLKIYVDVSGADRSTLSAGKVYECEKIVQSNPQYGFLALRIKGRHERYLPIAPAEQTVQVQEHELAAVGYSADAFPLLSVGCKAKPGFCSFCRPSSGNEMNRQVWGEAECLYAKGMAGSPVVFWKDKNRPMAVGMFGPIAGGNSGTNTIQNAVSLIRFPAIQLRFGDDLLGRQVE